MFHLVFPRGFVLCFSLRVLVVFWWLSRVDKGIPCSSCCFVSLPGWCSCAALKTGLSRKKTYKHPTGNVGLARQNKHIPTDKAKTNESSKPKKPSRYFRTNTNPNRRSWWFEPFQKKLLGQLSTGIIFPKRDCFSRK